jgi:hypothetical protein
MEMTMMRFDYEFEDVEIELEGQRVLASGSVDVEYLVEPSQRSVGFYGGVSVESFGEMFVVLISMEDGEELRKLTCESGHPIYDLVVKGFDPEMVADACSYDCASWF